MKKSLAIILSIQFVLMSFGFTKELTAEDEKALRAIFEEFSSKCLIKGEISLYPKYIEKNSLRAAMVEHRTFLNLLLKNMGEDALAKMFSFKPSLEAVLQSKDANSYFGAISTTPEFRKLSRAAGIVNKVVGVAIERRTDAKYGDSKRAYIVVEGRFDGEIGKTDPHYSVWPALLTKEGWKLDVTTTMVTELKGTVQRLGGRSR